jgi:hypothetical protein
MCSLSQCQSSDEYPITKDDPAQAVYLVEDAEENVSHGVSPHLAVVNTLEFTDCHFDP